jgi:hypothetical protein
MMQIQTTLAKDAPWPMSFPEKLPLVLGMEKVDSRIGMTYKKRVPKAIPRSDKANNIKKLLTHITQNPGQSMNKIRIELCWSPKKLELYMTEPREQVGNGYFRKSSLKEVAK